MLSKPEICDSPMDIPYHRIDPLHVQGLPPGRAHPFKRIPVLRVLFIFQNVYHLPEALRSAAVLHGCIANRHNAVGIRLRTVLDDTAKVNDVTPAVAEVILIRSAKYERQSRTAVGRALEVAYIATLVL